MTNPARAEAEGRPVWQRGVMLLLVVTAAVSVVATFLLGNWRFLPTALTLANTAVLLFLVWRPDWFSAALVRRFATPTPTPTPAPAPRAPDSGPSPWRSRIVRVLAVLLGLALVAMAVSRLVAAPPLYDALLLVAGASLVAIVAIAMVVLIRAQIRGKLAAARPPRFSDADRRRFQAFMPALIGLYAVARVLDIWMPVGGAPWIAAIEVAVGLAIVRGGWWLARRAATA